MKVIDILRLGPVMPVLVIDDLAHAVPLARALVAGGIRVLEVTLRTAVALDAVRAICAAVPDAVVGVGTITTAQDVADSKAAGAVFGVSPGLTAGVLDAAQQTDLLLLPGTMTPSDVMTARAVGLDACKLFPAAVAGGVGMLKALYGPFADMTFCPTGGIDPAGAPSYLALPNVACVGGSWLAPKALLQAGDWPAITALARAAAALRAG
ncbi:bifunctional 4-hydroxy-2-oxoglutarate aldolase/2-dehydro-3-deoxy-phosphogluconate aldolase [Immundisolibacter sp.]|uniref:bifunctional 4-hydroxy-2-oxoglutarate aldolase/2-dehydro-3-deoxy-phosphogluconate aldolase n=1 Tax=Immundisolibacter sp. TaxID=1934948 RepID=UPI00356962D5